jgi:fibronectin type 3 domain-containing protein
LRLALRTCASLLLLLVLLVGGCNDQIADPVKTDIVAGAPEIPHNVETLVGDGVVELTWEVSNPGAAKLFLIYRSDTSAVTPAAIDSTNVMNYRDESARNGVRYLYRIATLGTNGLVSKLSSPVVASPGLYSIVIDDGRKYSTSLTVTISSAAPAGTRYMLLTNDTLSSEGHWLSLSGDRSWQLTSGDGIKRVFAKFRDFDGNETIKYSSDDIILDTEAIIDSVTENSHGTTLAAGDILHIALFAEESGGQASAQLTGVGSLELFDDGTRGDVTKDDGIYELDYHVPGTVDVSDAVITGQFTDAAGNQAEGESSSTQVNIANPPLPAALTSYVVSESEIELIWTRSEATDFASYLLFRSESATVDTSSILVQNEASVGNNRFGDQNLDPAKDYYYAVYTQDRSGLKAKSNVVKATTMTNEAPSTVQLFVASAGSTSVALGWTKNDDADFASYNVYRSTSAGVQRTADNLKGVVTSQSSTNFNDNDVKAGTTYHYIVVVYDKYGAYSTSSNEVTVTTDSSG